MFAELDDILHTFVQKCSFSKIALMLQFVLNLPKIQMKKNKIELILRQKLDQIS